MHLDRLEKGLSVLQILGVLLPGCEHRGHALTMEFLGPLLHNFLTLHPKSVTNSGGLVLGSHELVSRAGVDLLQLCHLFAKFVLVLSHLE